MQLLAFYISCSGSQKIKRLVNFAQKYRETGFNSTKIAVTEIVSTTDAKLKLPERKRNEDAIQNLCNNVVFRLHTL